MYIKIIIISHMIEGTEDDSKDHLQYSQNEGLLHLVGVDVQQLVLCHIPNLRLNTDVR